MDVIAIINFFCMKRIFLLIPLTVFVYLAYAECNYYNSTTSWLELEYTLDNTTLKRYHIDSDTVVQSKTYQVVRNNKNVVVALLRTTNEGLVYRYNLHTKTETLIYDFGNWYVGKPLLIDKYLNSETNPDVVSSHIAEMGTITDDINNILDYMQAELLYKDGTTELVNEIILHGIGSTYNILYGMALVPMPNGERNMLLSFERDGKVRYDKGYKIYPINNVVSTTQLTPLVATIVGDSITISGSLFTGWEEDKCAIVSVTDNNVQLYLTNTTYNNTCDKYTFSVTAYIGPIKSDSVEIKIYNSGEKTTLYTTGVITPQKVCVLTLHREGDALMAVFPTASAGETITLYDATGRAVATQAIRTGATTATIDITALPTGVYIARLNSGATAKVVL